nr:hypothetical protein [Tanacetum cinerariifolium]
VLVTKPHNKTLYELLLGRIPSKGFMRPFGCPVTILNTLDLLDKAGKGNGQQYVLFPLWSSGSKDPQNTNTNATFEVKEPGSEVYISPSSSAKTKKHDDKTKREAKGKIPVDTLVPTVGHISTNSTNSFSAVGPSNTDVSPTLRKSSYADPFQYPDDPDMPALEDITYSDDEEDVGAEADFSHLETNITVSPIQTTRVHKDHPITKIIGDLSLAPQTRSMTRMVKEQGVLTQINNDDFHTCMFACFLSQEEPKRVWVLVDLPKGKRAIGSKWVFRNNKDERGIVVRTKARLVTQRHTQEDIIDYEEVFALVARIEAIRLFLAYASFMGFMVYQMDVKGTFLYETIKEEVYVCQPLGFEDHDYHDKVYKVVKALYGLHQAPKACQAKARWDFISQDKYVAKILRKFGLTDGKSASTPIDTEKPLLKDLVGEDVDVHTYSTVHLGKTGSGSIQLNSSVQNVS